MPTENTSLKNVTPAGDSNTINEMVNGKINTYQHTFLIAAGSLLALLVVIVVACASGGQHLQSSAYEIAEGAVALNDYQVDSGNLALTKDIFGLGAVSENDEGFCAIGPCGCWYKEYADIHNYCPVIDLPTCCPKTYCKRCWPACGDCPRLPAPTPAPTTKDCRCCCDHVLKLDPSCPCSITDWNMCSNGSFCPPGSSF